MANKTKAVNEDDRRELAAKAKEQIQRQHPEWSELRVNSEAYRAADQQLKQARLARG